MSLYIYIIFFNIICETYILAKIASFLFRIMILKKLPFDDLVKVTNSLYAKVLYGLISFCGFEDDPNINTS